MITTKQRVAVLLREFGENQNGLLSQNRPLRAFFPAGCDIYVLCSPDKADSVRRRGCLSYVQREQTTFLKAANAFATEHASAYGALLFWDCHFIPLGNCVAGMLDTLRDPSVLGVSPLFVIGGRKTEENTGRRGEYILRYGVAIDSTLSLRPLYEGYPLRYAQSVKRFQVASDRALLLRCRDFLECGLSDVPDELAGIELTARLHKTKGTLFVTDPANRARCGDPWLSLREFGLWNSYQDRGRIVEQAFVPDFHSLVAEDGLTCSVNMWLADQAVDGKADITRDYEDDDPTTLCLHFLASRDPLYLLRYLSLVTEKERASAVALCREFPVVLPRTMAWYEGIAEKKLLFAKEHGLTLLAETLSQWQKAKRRFHHKVLLPIFDTLVKNNLYRCSLEMAPASYDAWIEVKERTMSSEPSVQVWEDFPTLAVLVPVYAPDLKLLNEALNSVFQNTYSRWQLCLVDDASPNPELGPFLESLRSRPHDIRIERLSQNSHISHATNRAFSLSDAPYFCCLDQDDLLAPNALLEMACLLARNPDLEFVYSDEDKIDSNGVRMTPVFKSPGDPEQIFSLHLAAVSRSLFQVLDGFRPGLEGAQDFDFILRMLECTDPAYIAHIPQILYHWRIHSGSSTTGLDAKPYVASAKQRACEEGAARIGFPGKAIRAGQGLHFCMQYDVPESLRCSVIVIGEESAKRAGGTADENVKGRGIMSRPESWTEAEIPLFVDSLFSQRIKEIEICYIPLRGVNANLQVRSGNSVRVLATQTSWVEAVLLGAREARYEIVLIVRPSLPVVMPCALEQLAILASMQHISAAFGYLRYHDILWDMGWFPGGGGMAFPLGRTYPIAVLPSLFLCLFSRFHRSLGSPHACCAFKRDLVLQHGLSLDCEDYAFLDYVLRLEQKGMWAVSSPWMQQEVSASLGKIAGGLSVFHEKWGDVLANHPLRHPSLHASPDGGWTLF